MSYRFYYIVLPVLLFAFSGCKRLPPRPEGMPELTPCTILVTFGGEQLEEVSVRLQPKDPQVHNWAAGGQTDSDGKAFLKTALYYDGVVPGEYFVIFQKYAKPDSARPMAPDVPLIPIKYSKASPAVTIDVSTSQKEYVFTLDAL